MYWARADLEAILQVEAKDDNRAEITSLAGTDGVSGLSVLRGAPLVDLAQEVTIVVNGKEAPSAAACRAPSPR